MRLQHIRVRVHVPVQVTADIGKLIYGSRGVCQSAYVMMLSNMMFQGVLNTITVHLACKRMWCSAFRHSFHCACT